MAKQKKLKDFGSWWEKPPTGGYTQSGTIKKLKTPKSSKADIIERNNNFDKTIKKNNSKPFLSNKSNRTLLFRLISVVFALMFATLSIGDGTLKFIESYKTTIHNDNYAYSNGDITFYNYDWDFKLRQLDNFTSMFDVNEFEEQNLSPEFYQISLERLTNNGDISYNGGWSLTSSGEKNDFAKKVYYYRYKFRGDNQPILVRDFFEYENGKVIISQEKPYEKWVKQYNQRAEFQDSGFAKYFLNSTAVVLTLPTNFTYNLFCFFDFLLRW